MKSSNRTHVVLAKSTTGAPFSDAVLVGDTLYIAGRIGVDSESGSVPEDINTEISLLFDGLHAVLLEAGMGPENIVLLQVACPDPFLYDVFNEAYKNFFQPPYPARAFVGSGPLVRNAHFHVQGIAVR